MDTSVWVDHLRRSNPILDMHIRKRTAMMHSMALGELVCGTFSNRAEQLHVWRGLPRIEYHSHEAVIDWIESERLMGRGIGFTDAHLLYSTLQRPATRLWTRDKRLADLALRFDVAHPRND